MQAATFMVIRRLKSIRYWIVGQDVNFQELKYARSEVQLFEVYICTSETPCRSWRSWKIVSIQVKKNPTARTWIKEF